MNPAPLSQPLQPSPPSPPAAARSPAQLKAALWVDAAVQVYAVVMGERVPDLPALLAAADVAEYDCLLPGALPPAVQRRAPYLVRLRPQSPFSDWLLFKAAADLGEWGVLLRSASAFMPLRGALRELARARLPDGQAITLDWMDPTVLRALLPLLDPGQLATLFERVAALVIPGSASWSIAQLQLGQLDWQTAPFAA